MRLLILTALYPPAIGGAATYFASIVDRLVNCGDIEAIHILTERMPGQPHTLSRGKIRLLRWLPNRISTGQKPLPIHTATYILTQLWFALWLPRLVRQHQIDLIHFHTRYRGRLFYGALKKAGVPIVADLRDKMTDPAALVGIADRLLCCGEGVQQFAIDSGFPAEQTVLIPVAFDPPVPQPPSAVHGVRQRYSLGEQPYLLFVGDITYNKGVYDLLNAYESWQVHHPGFQLVLIGTNREGNRFLNQLQQTKGATYLGYVPHSDALALMQGAEIVVLPSRSEGLPTVILEAIALGRKVICPPNIPEFDRHCPVFVLPEVTPEAITAKLTQVLDGDASPHYPLEEHSLSRVVSQLLDVYHKILNEHRSNDCGIELGG